MTPTCKSCGNAMQANPRKEKRRVSGSLIIIVRYYECVQCNTHQTVSDSVDK